MGPSQVIMMDNSIRTHIRAISTTDTEIQAVFNTGQHVPSKKIENPEISTGMRKYFALRPSQLTSYTMTSMRIWIAQ